MLINWGFFVFEIYEVKNCRFGDIPDQRFTVLALKIPSYVMTYDLNYGMIRLTMTRATIPLFKIMSNY